jgi:hypothetical protein
MTALENILIQLILGDFMVKVLVVPGAVLKPIFLVFKVLESTLRIR